MYSMFMNLPPLPIRIIQESNTPDDFIKVAIQMCSDFSELRAWNKSFQEAITEDDINRIGEYHKLLGSITNHIESKLGEVKKGKISLSAGIGIFKVACNGDPVNDAMNKFGVRAAVNEVIMENSGKKELEKFCQIFNAKGSEMEFELKQHFRISYK